MSEIRELDVIGGDTYAEQGYPHAAWRRLRREAPIAWFDLPGRPCLGANLARLELRVIFRMLAERLRHVELAGPFERMRSSFVGGVKRMPIRFELSA